jgi:hypothetical protein
MSRPFSAVLDETIYFGYPWLSTSASAGNAPRLAARVMRASRWFVNSQRNPGLI